MNPVSDHFRSAHHDSLKQLSALSPKVRLRLRGSSVAVSVRVVKNRRTGQREFRPADADSELRIALWEEGEGVSP